MSSVEKAVQGQVPGTAFFVDGCNGRIVWVHTGLDIDNALDPSDDDRITVLPAV